MIKDTTSTKTMAKSRAIKLRYHGHELMVVNKLSSGLTFGASTEWWNYGACRR